jgi:hypothetical protein
MRAFMLATIWLALAGFLVGEAGKARRFRTGVSPRWAWPVWCAGLVACVIHIAIAMAHVHGWSHASAVMETARQTEAVYGVSWGGGVLVNYLFVAVWLGELVWWRVDPRRYFGQRAWCVWAVRVFYLLIVVNAAVIFAAPARRLAGVAVTAALLAVWSRRRRPASN